ncbi:MULTISPECIES: phosphatase PAP2 family protein [unclassified Roseateles]|uniref:phosphatase PAP2 family protein n=1 Tax=unclassified Roseateles TaxID=2626991 RepID=UPI0009EAC7F6|nr:MULTISPECIES: phosphatase PAP2 family protein [unclassified Roseateles]
MSGRRGELRMLAVLLMVVLAWDASGLDLVVAHQLGDARGFAMRDAFWARTLLHDALRWLEAAAWLLLGADAMRRQRPAFGPSRGQRRRALLGGVLTLLLVPALKSISSSSCPWSLVPFGGSAPWVSHWNWLLADGGPGHCFPSGHSAGVFAFCSWLWLWRPWRHDLGVRWPVACATLFGFGLLASFTQWARGAHFVSHSLWSAWLCASLTWVLARAPGAMLPMKRAFVWRRQRSQPGARPSASSAP